MPSKNDEPSSEPPKSINPYEVLSVDTDAAENDIKKAYRKAALKHHPDKAIGEEAKAAAHEKFQEVAFAYAILSEPGRRSRYDATGSTDEAIDLEDGSFDWLSFYRGRFEEVTAGMIKEFGVKYKETGEEKKDLLKAYTKFKGNMSKIYETVLLSNVLEDDERFRAILDEAIQQGEVESFDKYVNETEKSKQNRIEKAKREAKEADESLKEMDAKKKSKKTKASSEGNMNDLAALIRNKAPNSGGSFLDALEAKYTTKLRKGKRAAAELDTDGQPDEPSEEAFQAARARLEKKDIKGSDSSATRRPKRSKA